jgi:hypothetical protein
VIDVIAAGVTAPAAPGTGRRHDHDATDVIAAGVTAPAAPGTGLEALAGPAGKAAPAVNR